MSISQAGKPPLLLRAGSWLVGLCGTLLAVPLRLASALAALLFLVLISLLCLVIYLTGTTQGGLTLLSLAGDFAPVDIQVESAEGYLLDKLVLRGVAVKTDAADVNAAALVLHWSPAALLHRRVLVEELSVSDADIYLKPTEPSTEPKQPAEIPERIELPIGIQLDLLRVDDIRIHPAVAKGQVAEPLVIEKALVRQLAFSDRLTVEAIEFAGFNATAQLDSLQLDSVKPFPFSVQSQWTYQLPDFPRFAGGGPLSGDLNALMVEQQLKAPLNSSLKARLSDLLAEPAWDATVTLQNVKPQKIKPDLPDLMLKGTVSVTGKLAAGKPQYQSVANVTVDLPDYPNGKLKWDVRGDASKATITSLDARWAGGTLTGGGDVAWSPILVADLKLAARNFNPQPLAAEWPGNINGDLVVRAKLVDDAPEASVALTGLGGKLRGYPLAGGVQAKLSPNGQLALQKFNLTSGSATLSLAGNVYDLPVAAKTAGNKKQKKPRLDLSWKLNAPDMQALLPQASGAVRSSGTAKGSLPTPSISTRLDVQQLVVEGLQIGSADANIVLSDKQQWRVDLEGRAIKVGDENIRLVSIGSTGGIAQHGFKIELDADSLNARLQANGKWLGDAANQRWVGQLESLSLAPEVVNGWSLAAPARIEAGPKAASLGRACLIADNDPIEVVSQRVSADSGNSSSRDRRRKKKPARRAVAGPSPNRELCLAGQWSQEKGWQADVDLSQLNIKYFRQFLPVNPEIVTEVNGKIRAAGKPGEAIQADAELKLDAGAIVPERDDLPRLEFAAGGISASLRNEALQAKVLLPLLQNNRPSGQLAANIGYRLSDGRLSGEINTLIADLTPIASFSPELDRTRGELLVDFDISGTVKKPVVTGQAHIRNGSALIPAAGLELDDIEITLSGDPQGRLKLKGGMKSGGGALTLAGSLQLVEGGANADVKVSGSDFQALNIADARVWISPEITVALVPGRVDVGGILTVPKAEITPKKLPESNGGVSTSGDVVIVGEDTEELTSGMATNIDIQLKLGEKVSFNGFGLHAELGGQMRFVDSAATGQRATGELLVKTGEYKALGQDLSITDGRLIFAGGPLDNPGVDIKATRLATDGTVAGLLVRGSVRKPDFSVYSEPSYPDDIALAYLITGKPPGQATGAEKDAMGVAVGALTQRGGDFIAKRLGSRLGFDDVQFDAGESLEAATVTIGRYLTPKLYVSYGVGLFDSDSSLQLRYEISNRWRMETQSGRNVGGDLFYSLER